MKDTFGHKNRDVGNGPLNRSNLDAMDDPYRSAKYKSSRHREENRATEIRRDTDIQKNVSVSLEDIDKAIMYQFNERFNFHVNQDDQRIKVPVIYDNQERWAWAKKQQHLRTINDKVVFPIIAFQRESVNRDTTKENMNYLNQRVATFSQTGENVFMGSSRYSKQNRYDNFSVLKDRTPVREFYIVTVPNYVILSYDFQIFTEYMYQMNRIIEEIAFMGNDYWGNAAEYLFKVRAENFAITPENDDASRFIRGTFSVEVNGYIIPEYVQEIAQTQKAFTNAKVVVDERIVGADGFSEERSSSFFRDRSNKSETLYGVPTVVDINSADMVPYESLRNAIIDTYNVHTVSEFNKLTKIKISDSGSIEDVELNFFRNLNQLSIYDNNIYTMKFSNTPNLKSIYLGKNNLSDVSPLLELERLETLDLSDNLIDDITPLSELTNLVAIALANNEISTVGSFDNLVELKWIYLQNNDLGKNELESIIDDLHSLRNIIKGCKINLEGNPGSNEAAISKEEKIAELVDAGCKVKI